MIEGERKPDFEYFVKRAREERAIAATSNNDIASLAHKKLAAEYERRAGRLIAG